jgi:cytochrome o ubiquinol oxidase subunit 2
VIVGHRALCFDALAIMLTIVVPTFSYWLFAWYYRATNKRAVDTPKLAHSGLLELIV